MCICICTNGSRRNALFAYTYVCMYVHLAHNMCPIYCVLVNPAPT